MPIRPGSPYPLGATWDGRGVNFAIFSEHATSVALCLFDAAAAAESRSMPLSKDADHVWHVYVPGLAPGQLYGYRVAGPWAPTDGHRFDATKVLLDPYAKAVGREIRYGPSLFSVDPESEAGTTLTPADSAASAPLAAVVDPAFDWKGDAPPRTPLSDTVMYELHVKGFSALQPALEPELRGTYLGLASPISIQHLLDLGVTAVELMPVHFHVDEWAVVRRGLANYWGYNSLGYFAPDTRFATSGERGDAVREFKTMVRTLHAAGLEVILDVVYNHTAEGDHRGPTLCFRGLDNAAYYRRRPDRPEQYLDVTGCGNTLNTLSPRVLQLVIDSLRYWVEDMHVDGFRFDLAPALARGQSGAVDPRSPFFSAIREDPVVSRVKLIAEPWDAAEDGQFLGGFPPGWSEWNGRYRDAVRRFWRGDAGAVPELAMRLSGSGDLFAASGRPPQASINFVTSHDGFTLADLVSYNEKHNDANGEQNRDGESRNFSVNGGVEGSTGDPKIIALRERLRRNFLLTMFVSLGVPMISGGDEQGRTQEGNNNAYCQDSPLSWTPWHSPDRALCSFIRQLAALRRAHPVLRRETLFGTGPADDAGVRWLTPAAADISQGEWADPQRRALAILFGSGDRLLVLLNSGPEALPFTMPGDEGGHWTRVLDTADPEGGPATVPAGSPWTATPQSASIWTHQA